MGCVTMTQDRPDTTTAVQQTPRHEPATAHPVALAGSSVGMPVVVQFDDSDSLVDTLDALLLTQFVTGAQPFARTKRLDRIRADATLLPPGATPVRMATGSGADSHIAIGDGWTLRAVRWTSGGGEVSVTAVSDDLARSVLELATNDAAAPPEAEDERVEIGFWHLTLHGPRRRARPIAASRWPEIKPNYSSTAAEAIDRLVGLGPDNLAGRVLLLHGPPGTGKTTVLRSLAREWRTWCQLDFVLDPERLFAEPGYLTEVVIGAEDEATWRLLLLEDCDELIRSDAKQSTGQALARLLNLTDGLLGQGRQVLVAITTNENIGRLHPAVTRPGRCLAQIEVGPLPYRQACAWLGTAGGIGPAGATLAHLYALRDGGSPVATPEPPSPGGFYL